MKKLMFVAAIAAGLVAFGEGIESANTVGYQTTTVKANGMTMIGIQFTETGSTDGIAINGIKGDFTAGPTQGEADNLYVWDAVNGYSFYFYYVGEEPDADYDYKWYDANNDAEPTTDKIAPGQAMWYVRLGTAMDVTFAGEVLGTDKAIPVKANSMTMFCSPYPTITAIQNIGVANPTAGPTQGEADNLYVWDATNGYSFYFYYVGEEPDAEYDYKWYDANNDAEPTSDTIAPGQAAWYVRIGAATTISFESPVK